MRQFARLSRGLSAAAARRPLPRAFSVAAAVPNNHTQTQHQQTRPPAREPSVASQNFVSFLHDDGLASGWGVYAAQTVIARAGGDPAKKQQLSFLTLAFREFDLDKNSVLDRDELKLALASLNLPAGDADAAALLAAVDENADDVIQLDEWLDNLPEDLKLRLHEHASAEAWRRLAFGRGFTDP